MKSFLIPSAIGFCFLATSLPLSAGSHVLKSGKTISGDPLTITDREVVFRESGSFRSIKVQLTDLSAASLDALKVWRETPANWKLSIKAKQVVLNRTKTKDTDRTGPSRFTKQNIREDRLWEVEIKNESGFAIPALDLHFTQFKETVQSQFGDKFQKVAEQPFSGMLKILPLNAHAAQSVRTRPVELLHQKSETTQFNSEYATRSESDRLDKLDSLNLRLDHRQTPFMTWTAGDHGALGIVPFKPAMTITVIMGDSNDPLDPKRLILPPKK